MSKSPIPVLFVMLLTAGTAHADDRAGAREHYMKGKRAFELGAFDEAIQEYETAYRLKDDPALLYNLGQAYRLAGHSAESLHFYKMYLTRSPNAPNRDEVETKIDELDKLLAQQKRTESLEPNGNRPLGAIEAAEPGTVPAVIPPPAPPRPSWSETHPGGIKTIAGIALAAVGVGAVATGITFGVIAQKNAEDLTNLNRNKGVFDPDKQSAGKSAEVIEGVMLGVGAAAAAAGVTLIVLGRRDAKRSGARETAAAMLPWIAPGAVGASVQGRF